jgi:integrase
MMAGRPRTAIGTTGTITVRRRDGRAIAETRVRDADGRVRQVRVCGRTAEQARQRLKQRLLTRPGFERGGMLRPDSSFSELAELWLADLKLRDLAEGTKQFYRDQLRLHVRPALEHYTLAEVTTARVEWFLQSQSAVSSSRGRQSRTLLNLLFGFALRHDALSRNPVEGTSPLPKPKVTPQALSLEQIAAIRAAAASWRTEPGLPGPKNDGQVRDIIEVLLGTAMRPGEVLALRPCDITDGPNGMVVHVNGTVVQRKGRGTLRQDHPKTDASVRRIPVPEFAAEALRRRMEMLGSEQDDQTVFAGRSGSPLSPHNVRRTFRDFLKLAELADTGISLRWYRRTGATVIARGLGADAAAAFLGHTSTTITEGHYIEPVRRVDAAPADQLERALRPENPDGSLLTCAEAAGEDALLAAVDREGEDDVVA